MEDARASAAAGPGGGASGSGAGAHAGGTAAGADPRAAAAGADASGHPSSSAREMRRLEADLRRREAEVVNLERRLKQSKENLRATELEGEAREKALTALVRSLEERVARKQGDAPRARAESAKPGDHRVEREHEV